MAPKNKVKCRASKRLKLKNKLNKISESNSETKSRSKQEPVFLRKSHIKKAIKFLNQTETRKRYQIDEGKRRASKCKLPIYQLQQNDNVYDSLSSMSYLNISRHMRTCILNHDWNNLTKLLILFFDAKKQNPIKYRNAFINLLNNPDAIRHNYLDEFLQMFVCCRTEEEKITFMNKLLSIESNELIKNEKNLDSMEIEL
ncbi:uncharacterized protein LOC123305370 [Chrysoperla carnea]|uniref:uncharacterized protein LOC123305370 n=1 Tax=Chrysoperla carnea TaxID=189513 RepID=UPI001D0855EC|nr:uncharacterized protein LOC123305370 [Chrysoperla carnea]